MPEPATVKSILYVPGVAGFVAEMTDGDYRWTTEDLRLRPNGPDRKWMEQRLSLSAPMGCLLVRHANKTLLEDA